MRRKDRLFELIQILRDGALHRATDLAARFGVSERTMYRDMETLIAAGVPVEGERGVGYMMTAAITLPPLNLSQLELEALHVGLILAGQVGDPDMKTAATTLSEKVDAILPHDRRSPASAWGFAAQPLTDAIEGFRYVHGLRSAVKAMQKVAFDYPGGDGGSVRHTVRPLALDYWGRVWTLAAWSENANDFAEFRADKMEHLRPLPANFVDEPGKAFADYQRWKR